MKYVKILGLAAVAAMALMASIGAGTASATVLCNVNILTTGCTTATPPQHYPAGTPIHASLPTGNEALLETTGGTILDRCKKSTIKGEVKNAGSSTTTVSGPIQTLTWEECTTTTNTVITGELEIHHIAGTDNGTLTAKNTQVTVVVFGESCIYGAGAGLDLGTLKGGSPATISINTIVKKVGGGGLCPAETRWTASYTVNEPNPLYVSAS
jgi:hypothetical protein